MEEQEPNSNLDEEIELIKSKLNLIISPNSIKSSNSHLNKPETISSPQLSLAHDTLLTPPKSKCSETNAIISSIDSIIIEDHLNNLKDLEEDQNKSDDIYNNLLKKDQTIKALEQEIYRLQINLEVSQSHIEQLEVDLEYCMEQNTQAYEEIQQLTNELFEYQASYESNGKYYKGLPSQMNYKITTETDFRKNENAYLRQQVDVLEYEKNLLSLKLKDIEKKYSDLINDISLMKKGHMPSNKINPLNPGLSSNTQVSSVEFQRLIAASLEKENKVLKTENNYLSNKLSKLKLEMKFPIKTPDIITELIKLLKVRTEKELYTRVMYLYEFYNQNKDQEKLLQKILLYVEKQSGQVGISISELGDYFTI
ncbi:hypothetical protein SteCoe_19679 [Stentor coeruleus]|uniref:Uncharacterized protein n=1 Tax=Stentor coeruleus TaxID=5963 RepID=A0A1R2BTQ7_9CILI|nr:hypothetical protein SteCoe_19679 [Stentor coeruleus]